MATSTDHRLAATSHFLPCQVSTLDATGATSPPPAPSDALKHSAAVCTKLDFNYVSEVFKSTALYPTPVTRAFPKKRDKHH